MWLASKQTGHDGRAAGRDGKQAGRLSDGQTDTQSDTQRE